MKDIAAPTDEELAYINSLLLRVGGANVQWGAINKLEVLLTERRLRADQQSADRLTRATWALVGCTAALVLATVALVFQ